MNEQEKIFSLLLTEGEKDILLQLLIDTVYPPTLSAGEVLARDECDSWMVTLFDILTSVENL